MFGSRSGPFCGGRRGGRPARLADEPPASAGVSRGQELGRGPRISLVMEAANDVWVDEWPRDMAEFERALLRRGVADRGGTHERCSGCHRTPLIGERIYVVEDGPCYASSAARRAANRACTAGWSGRRASAARFGSWPGTPR